MKKIEFLYFTVAKKMCVNCSTLSSSCHFFFLLLESSWARINWIRAVDKFCVEQLISWQKCRANDCRAIEFRAVHPHSCILKPAIFMMFLLSFRWNWNMLKAWKKSKLGWAQQIWITITFSKKHKLFYQATSNFERF